jgi:hypothetical protein
MIPAMCMSLSDDWEGFAISTCMPCGRPMPNTQTHLQQHREVRAISRIKHLLVEAGRVFSFALIASQVSTAKL